MMVKEVNIMKIMVMIVKELMLNTITNVVMTMNGPMLNTITVMMMTVNGLRAVMVMMIKEMIMAMIYVSE